MADLETRQKILYGALVLILLLYVGDAGFRRLYEEPLAAAEQRSLALQNKRNSLRKEVAEGKRTVKLLNELRKQSLPRELELARSEYQNWVLQLAHKSELRQIGVDATEPARRTSKGQVLYHSLQFSLRGRGTMPQITQLLYDFYEAGYLHKIRNLTLSPILGTEQVTISASIEALVLNAAVEKKKLPDGNASQLAFSGVDAYGTIPRRDLFAIGGGGRPGSHIKLTAITTSVRGIKEAWFANLRTGQTMRLGMGDAVPGMPFEPLLAEVNDEFIVLNFEGEIWQLAIGLTIAESTVEREVSEFESTP